MILGKRNSIFSTPPLYKKSMGIVLSVVIIKGGKP
jgi:hypothetical protein